MSSIDVHGAGTANTLTARAAEGKGWINLILDLDQSIQNHWTTLVHVDIVSHIFWFVLWVIWIRSVNIESLKLRLLFLSQTLVELDGIIGLHDITQVAKAWWDA